MSKEISLNSVELMTATSKAKSAIDGINVTVDQWANQGENSISLQAFSDQFCELERTMVLYQKLLDQDVETVRKIVVEFFLSEFNLAKLWGSK